MSKKMVPPLRFELRLADYETAILTNYNMVASDAYQFRITTFYYFDFQNSIKGMTTKTGIIRSLKQYYQTNELSRQAQYSCFDSTATTYIITAGQDNIEMASFIQRFNQIQRKCFNKEAVPLKHCQDNMWLLKPANFNQGRGIEIFKNLKEIQQFLNTRKPNSLWVAQKYIEKPFLFKQRKFDIRVWVLVTQQGEVFFHKFPYVRTSSAKYDTSAQDNYVHLTNNCLQQKGNSYGQHEDGNTLPVEDLFEYIKEKYPNQQTDIQQFIMQKMKDLVIDTFNAIKDQMLNSKRNYCYELFGYDFLIDEDLRVWLIETNLNPYLGVPNSYIGNILPKMINSMFQIILDPHFPPSQNYKNGKINDQIYKKILKLTILQVENQFDLIYCDNNSIYNDNKPINTRSPFTSSLYPIDELRQIPNYKQYQDIKKQQQQQIKIQIQTPVIKENSKRKSKNTLQYDSKCQNNKQSNIFSKKNLNKTGDLKLKEQGQKFSLPSINQNNSNLNMQNDKKNQNDENDTYRRQNSRKSGQNIHKVNLSTSNLNKSYYEESSEEENSKLTLSQKHKQIFSESKIIKQHKSKNKNEIPLTLEQINEKQGLQMKEIYHKVKNLIKNYPYQDYEPLQNYVQNCLTKLINWELYDENEIEWTIKTIQIVMNSRFIGVFSEQKNIDTLIQIIDSQNFLLKIQLIAIQLIKYICKNVSLKLFVLGKDITKSLMKIALSTVDPREREKYDQQLRLEAIRSIITLGGIYDRKAFIPGETRKNDDARRSLIENGGVLALIQIKHQTDEDLIIEQMKKFFLNLDLKDYEQQLDLIVQWIEKFKCQKKDKENQSMVVNMLDAGNQEIDIQDNVQDMQQKSYLLSFLTLKFHSILINLKVQN
ncbi:hypothetical protein PPERSA_09971 [Pseudocohnilembus persalinus]|uniref:Uncharacterized protein n=1 Tax=Pseudocohnilembus persalinus TaxID=266149 RepID=A0A0V0QJH6_PSEPJ|nr:hypothetical protein PPERSA_09971 [Pseudocohnilembus persalinus]|eukprot:KRX02354.1 hypothetical protein PPERSA_09971 [Pseudocohnilembus persalinus]